ncbi:transporter [Pseudochelatococcus lubricantis]|uniref:SphA family protein n=1 Tax=Pseudochelatococcus lubricantis TaxID=1538102 RepID=UPI0035EDFE0F
MGEDDVPHDRYRRIKVRLSRIAVPCVGAAALFAVCGPAPVRAAENGVGMYLLGSRGPMAGFLPPPGFYVQNDFYFYDGDLSAGKSFPAGGRVVSDVKAQARTNLLSGTWVLPHEVLGGNVAIGAILPFGRTGVTAGLDVDAPRLGIDAYRSLRDKATVFGDPVATASLGWHAGKFHWNIAGMLNVPVGDYRDGQLANLAFHRWAGDISAAVTWLDPEKGLDLSVAAGFTFNGENPKTDYRTGTEFHIEWAVTQFLSKDFSIGVVGYHYEQLTGDGGRGARLGSYKGRVTAVGGSVGYNFTVGEVPVSTRLKVFREFNTRNRMEGTAGIVTVALPLATGQ